MKLSNLLVAAAFVCCIQQLRAQIVCSLDLNSYGNNDEDDRTAWIKVNGKTVFTHTYSEPARKYRGVITLKLDPKTCETSGLRSFDTHFLSRDGNQLATYIQHLSGGIVLIAVTSDDPKKELHNGVWMLNALGLKLGELNVGGKFAFVTLIGQKSSTVSSVQKSGGKNLHLAVDVKSDDSSTWFERHP